MLGYSDARIDARTGAHDGKPQSADKGFSHMSEDDQADQTKPEASRPRGADYGFNPQILITATRPGQCFHPSLGFASGGYYVMCRHCGVMWAAIGPDNKFDADRANAKLTMADTRDVPMPDRSPQVGAGDGTTVVPRHATVEDLDRLRQSIERHLHDLGARLIHGPDRRV